MFKKINMLQIVFGIVWGGWFLVELRNYLDYSATIAISKPIPYSFVEKKVSTGGRSDTYILYYEYNHQKGDVDIFRKD